MTVNSVRNFKTFPVTGVTEAVWLDPLAGLNLDDWAAKALVVGVTRMGKTRLFEAMIEQQIRASLVPPRQTPKPVTDDTTASDLTPVFGL